MQNYLQSFFRFPSKKDIIDCEKTMMMILDYIHLIILIQKYAGDLVCCWQMAISKIRKCLIHGRLCTEKCCEMVI